MPPIQCPRCGTEVSDAAPHCPQCGMPLHESEVEDIDLDALVAEEEAREQAEAQAQAEAAAATTQAQAAPPPMPQYQQQPQYEQPQYQQPQYQQQSQYEQPQYQQPQYQQPYQQTPSPAYTQPRQQSSSGGLWALIAILALLILGGAGYLIYNMVHSNVSEQVADEIDSSYTVEEAPYTPQRTARVKINGSHVRLRTAPSYDSSVAGLYDYGDSFEYVSTDGEWYEVRYNGETYYVSTQFAYLSYDE